MVTLLTNILTPSEDLWLFAHNGSDFSYNLSTKQIKITDLNKAARITDQHSNIHLFILKESSHSYHVIWDNINWQKYNLPFDKWEDLITFVDSVNRLYILIKTSSGLRLWMWDGFTYSPIPISIQDSHLKPLYFIIDSSYMYLYITDIRTCTILVYTMTLSTGKSQSCRILYKDEKYRIIKYFVGNDYLILVTQKMTSDKNIQVLKISLQSYKYSIIPFVDYGIGRDTSYHLLADKNYLLFLTSFYNRISFMYSADGGKQWTNPQESTLFAPSVFSDIQSVNNSLTHLINIEEIKGIYLQNPLILTLTELYSILCADKVIYRDSVFKTRKSKGFFNRLSRS